jgi:hypothetical protein
VSVFRQFDPPYESRLEENFAWDLTKYLSEAAVLRKQVEAVTPFATFRLDFVAETRGGSRVAFECDGKEFHPDGMRDQCRDALLLDGRHVDVIYRLRGQDLYHHPDDCLLYISRHDPYLFSDRGLRNLTLLGSEEMLSTVEERVAAWGDWACGYDDRGRIWVDYVDEDRGLEHSVCFDRRSRDWISSGTIAKFLQLARGNRRASFDGLVRRFGKGERVH